MSGIVRCAAVGCMAPVSIEMRFPAGQLPEFPYPYCCSHAVVVARAFGAEEATPKEEEDAGRESLSS